MLKDHADLSARTGASLFLSQKPTLRGQAEEWRATTKPCTRPGVAPSEAILLAGLIWLRIISMLRGVVSLKLSSPQPLLSRLGRQGLTIPRPC